MNIVATLFYFILALLLLVTVHEFGHFIVARWCGVKVLRFSFGFGKVLASWRDQRGTEYAWSAIPLGGYVKMLDEEEDPVAECERHMAFNNQSLWKKIIIAFAGPLFNFVFAYIALWLVLVVGIYSLAPMIASVTPGSVAAKAGLSSQQEIIALNHRPIVSWRDFQYALMPYIGSADSVPITVKSMRDGMRSTYELSFAEWPFDGKNPDVLASLGIKPFIPHILPIVGSVLPDSPAQTAGFEVGDVIVAVDGVQIADWLGLLDKVKQNPGKLMSFAIKRHEKGLLLSAKLGTVTSEGQTMGLLGVRSKQPDWPQGWLRIQRQGPIDALGSAFRQTIELTGASFALVGKLVTGKVSLQGVSGPVGIAEGAGESARGGFSYYMAFLALISISLGVLNLLPIPLLDGGHLLYYFVELIRRRPLSMEFKSIGMYIGFTFMIALMVLALTNDLGRLMHSYK